MLGEMILLASLLPDPSYGIVIAQQSGVPPEFQTAGAKSKPVNQEELNRLFQQFLKAKDWQDEHRTAEALVPFGEPAMRLLESAAQDEEDAKVRRSCYY